MVEKGRRRSRELARTALFLNYPLDVHSRLRPFSHCRDSRDSPDSRTSYESPTRAAAGSHCAWQARHAANNRVGSTRTRASTSAAWHCVQHSARSPTSDRPITPLAAVESPVRAVPPLAVPPLAIPTRAIPARAPPPAASNSRTARHDSDATQCTREVGTATPPRSLAREPNSPPAAQATHANASADVNAATSDQVRRPLIAASRTWLGGAVALEPSVSPSAACNQGRKLRNRERSSPGNAPS